MRPILILIAFLLGLSSAQAYTEADLKRDDDRATELFRAGDLRGAERIARESFVKASAAFGEASAPTLNAGILVVNTLSAQNRDDEGAELYAVLYALAQKTYAPYHPDLLRMAVGYGQVLSASGQPDKALPLVADAVAAASLAMGPDSETTLKWKVTLAGIYAELGNLEPAIEQYQSIAAALDKIATTDNLRLRGDVQNNIGVMLKRLGRDAEAARYYARALPMQAEVWGPNHPYTLNVMNDFAFALWGMRDLITLPPVLEDLSRRAVITYGANSLFLANIHQLRALTQSADGPQSLQFAAALGEMQKAVDIVLAELPKNSPGQGRMMLDYAAMLEDAGQTAKALDMALQAEASGYPSRNLLYDLILRASDEGVWTYEAAGAEVLRIMQQSSNSQAARATELLATRLALGQGTEAVLYREATDRSGRQSQLEAQLLAAVSLPTSERDATAEALLRQQMSENSQAITSTMAKLSSSQPRLADLTGNGVLSLAEVRSAIGPDGVLVVLDVSTEENATHMAMAVTQDGLSFAPLRWTTQSFYEAVSDVRKGISLKLGTRAAASLSNDAPAPERSFDFYAAHWLFRETIGQVLAITGSKKHLYIDARGALGSIPPHLLIVNDDPSATEMSADWLIKHFAITVLPSIYSLKIGQLAETGVKPTQPLLGFANPQYTDTGRVLAQTEAGAGVLRNELAPLPETAFELRQVAEAIKADPAAERIGDQASEAGLKATNLADYSILYFATHGLVSGDAVGQSVLGEPALALAAGQGEDGLLTATEISDLKLNADFVVLSACNTAVGDEPGAEALSGLAKAFTYAGARSLLVSHWPVESRSAVRLMTDLFARRAADPTLDAATAQQQTLLAMIHNPPNPRWSHPAYWAPFVLVGDPG